MLVRLTLLTVLLFAPVKAFSQGTPDVAKYTIEQFLKTTNYRGASFSPDFSKILASSDATGVFNVSSLPVNGDEPTQLTHSETESMFSVSYFPADERFLYSADKGGDELDHLFVRHPDGTTTDLTPGENLKAQFMAWAYDDRSFYVGTNERDPRYFDVYQYDTESLERELVFQNEDGYFPADVSPDGKVIALAKINNRDDSDIFLFNRDTGETTHLTPHEGEANFSLAAFSPDGEYAWLITDADSDFKYLVRQNLESGARETIARPEWDVAYADISKHGKYLVIATNEDGRTRIDVRDTASGESIELPEVDGANIDSIGISRDEQHLALYISADKIPGDLYYLKLANDETTVPARLTRSLNPVIDPAHLVSGEVVRFKSFDGREIPGILYRPHQATPAAQVPALVWVHGGPGGQSRVGYSALVQFLVNHGYAVYAINNRGSSGYGKQFEQLDNRDHGKGDLSDCVASKQMLVETGYVDPEAIGIIGGSYGGYMVLAALAFQPDEFAAGVDIFGVSNWHRTVQSIPPWWEAQRAALETELGDFGDEEYFKSISPLFHADKIERPLMVLQGANDPRVLKVESDEIVEAVRTRDIPVEYLVFDDEGHGFRKKENQARGYQAILEFCDSYLKRSPDYKGDVPRQPNRK